MTVQAGSSLNRLRNVGPDVEDVRGAVVLVELVGSARLRRDHDRAAAALAELRLVAGPGTGCSSPTASAGAASARSRASARLLRDVDRVRLQPALVLAGARRRVAREAADREVGALRQLEAAAVDAVHRARLRHARCCRARAARACGTARWRRTREMSPAASALPWSRSRHHAALMTASALSVGAGNGSSGRKATLKKAAGATRASAARRVVVGRRAAAADTGRVGVPEPDAGRQPDGRARVPRACGTRTSIWRRCRSTRAGNIPARSPPAARQLADHRVAVGMDRQESSAGAFTFAPNGKSFSLPFCRRSRSRRPRATGPSGC